MNKKQMPDQGYRPDKKGYQPQSDKRTKPAPPKGGTGQTRSGQDAGSGNK